jgi:hypothetical protein
MMPVMSVVGDAAPTALRTTAIDLVRAGDWAPLLDLMPQLERDEEYWAQLWGPCCAIAAAHIGRADSHELLRRVVEAGFHEPDDFDELEALFGDSPDWPALRARMLANRPAPLVELLDWPTASPQLAPELFRLPADAEQQLAARLPAPAAGAWDTAEQTLAWVTSRWRHTSANHAEQADGNLILDRVAHGERFACKEFTILLTQALNALRIPARRVALFRADHHAGLGTGHAVTEAWIDDLGRWVLLDGQNGAIWRNEHDAPIGVVDMQERHRAGERPAFTGTGPNFDATTADSWFGYFATATVTGLGWSSPTFVPVYEGRSVITTQRLERSAQHASPDLAAVTTGVVDDGGPALTFTSAHPFALGVTVSGAGGSTPLGPGELFPLNAPVGEHRWSVATRTDYGHLRSAPLVYVTA